jgi:hypothetical protein
MDVMWVQYLMTRLARDPIDRDAQRIDRFQAVFVGAERRLGKRFLIDGKYGSRTDDMIRAYQKLGLSLPLNGMRGGDFMEMTSDGVVHPAPDGGKTVPITSTGTLYTIAHMNERFHVLHRSYQDFIATDPDAPEPLKRRVQEILPRTTGQPFANPVSGHVARARHFPRM